MRRFRNPVQKLPNITVGKDGQRANFAYGPRAAVRRAGKERQLPRVDWTWRAALENKALCQTLTFYQLCELHTISVSVGSLTLALATYRTTRLAGESDLPAYRKAVRLKAWGGKLVTCPQSLYHVLS